MESTDNGRLVLTRRIGEAIQVGDDVCVQVVRIDGSKVRIGISAPRDVRILRAELEPKG